MQARSLWAEKGMVQWKMKYPVYPQKLILEFPITDLPFVLRRRLYAHHCERNRQGRRKKKRKNATKLEWISSLDWNVKIMIFILNLLNVAFTLPTSRNPHSFIPTHITPSPSLRRNPPAFHEIYLFSALSIKEIYHQSKNTTFLPCFSVNPPPSPLLIRDPNRPESIWSPT